jgi:phosphatidylglycerophosphate synthase
VEDRPGPAGWIGWFSLLYGAILCDWLDGPIARHLGTSEIGEAFDLEVDSWLTLVAALSAARWGALPRAVAVPPILRYVSTFAALRNSSYADLRVDEPGWVRRMGIVQMLLFIAALAPFGGKMTRFALRVVAPVQTPLQLAGLIVLHRRRSRR